MITLPSMDPELAEAVLEKIASHIRNGMTADRVHEAVRAVRTAARPVPPAAADRPVEQALDICLFRRDLRRRSPSPGSPSDQRTEPVGSSHRVVDGERQAPRLRAVPKERTDEGYDDAPLEPGGSYFRLWLSEMFLTKRVAGGGVVPCRPQRGATAVRGPGGRVQPGRAAARGPARRGRPA